ncbi:MAG TPA: YdcF family protein [Candidatus Copromorpha excrementigallinarum]|uniref:YdcF family protein n=1 Tax=Candidatus Allocopromorpha excrementigallinarum TaxID=2840742 RepID=A0A9D1I4F8_9FIRM|nr:YdcF family protein [Candidatus Copromorpha excrementigallinarum]
MRKEKKDRGILARIFFTLVKLCLLAAIVIICINIFVIKSTEDKIVAGVSPDDSSITSEEIESLLSVEPDCIMVLGASVKADGTPSRMLQDRLDLAVELYHRGVAPKLLLTGDNGQVNYNEVKAMKEYAAAGGVPEEDIFLDHAGFSTYESVYRAKYIFKVDRMVVVTQKYHLYRALYGCGKMGIEALGAASDQETYRGQEYREIREILARDKDCIKWIFRPEPTYLGDPVPIGGSGVETH